MTKIKLYSNCIPVKGYTRSIIIDLQYSEAYLIPNALYDILTESDGLCDIDKILENKNTEDCLTLTEYFNFLKSKKLVFQANDLSLFPSLSFEYRHYSLLTNATLDIDNNYNINVIIDIVKQLNSIGCEAVQLRFFGTFDALEINRLTMCFETTRIKHIELQLESWTESTELAQIFNKRIRKIIINNSRKNKSEISRNITIEFRTSPLTCQCAINSVSDMNFTMKFFIEAKQHNSCLNRKIAIKCDGTIRNCPYSDEVFGSIYSDKLVDIILLPDFQKYWNVNKNLIDACNVCEFRFCCTDCRVFVSNASNSKSNVTSRPTNCAYNPYIGKWSYERGFSPITE